MIGDYTIGGHLSTLVVKTSGLNAALMLLLAWFMSLSVVSIGMSVITQWPWPMIGAVVAAISLILGGATFATILYVNFLRPARRRKTLTKPVDAHFVVRAKKYWKCDFAVQDEDEDHMIKDVILPSNQEALVDINIIALVSFSYAEVIVGCDGDDLDSKPRPTEYNNRFMREGRGRVVVPNKEDSDDYIDIHNFYHRKVVKTVSPGTNYTLAFKIKTGRPGVYPFRISFIGDEIEGVVSDLFVTVENNPKTLMRCVWPSHRRKQCAKGIAPLTQSERPQARRDG